MLPPPSPVLAPRQPVTITLPLVVQGFGNRVQAFLDGFVDEAAGVDDDQVGALKSFGGLVTLSAQLRQDQLGIGQRLGATQADKTHFGGGLAGGKEAVAVISLMPPLSPQKRLAL